MSEKSKLYLILGLLLALFLTGCRCDNSVIPTFFGIADSPADGEITSLFPSFDWHGSDSCEPDEYILHMEEGGFRASGPIHTNIAEALCPTPIQEAAFFLDVLYLEINRSQWRHRH